MKKIFNIMFAVVVCFVAAACQKEDIKDSVDPSIVGEWHLETVEVDGDVQDYPYDVYLVINADCSFKLYQKSGTQTRYTKFTGICKTEGTTFSGSYSSGTPLNGEPYTVSIEDGRLILITEDGLERQEYVKEALPQKDKEDADISTKAASDSMTPIL